MKACEFEVYAKHIVQPLGIHFKCLFWCNLNLDMLVAAKILSQISESKNSIQSNSYQLEKIFLNPPPKKEIMLLTFKVT